MTTEKTVFQKSEQPQLASSMGSGSLDVLATPAVVALMEYAAFLAGLRFKYNKELTNCRTRIAIDPHQFHTRRRRGHGDRLTAQTGRNFQFEVSAADQKGEIARGTHTRVSVKAKSFQKKADTKFNRYTYVLFDLDGTISRSAEGIRASLEHAIKQLEVLMPGILEYHNHLYRTAAYRHLQEFGRSRRRARGDWRSFVPQLLPQARQTPQLCL